MTLFAVMLVLLTGTGRPTWVPSTRKVTVPAAEQFGAVGSHWAGWRVAVTTKAMEYCGLAVGGVETAVVRVVLVSTASGPASAIAAAGRLMVVAFDSI